MDVLLEFGISKDVVERSRGVERGYVAAVGAARWGRDSVDLEGKGKGGDGGRGHEEL